MTGTYSANFVCKQILRVIKESELNYLINETPYSSFITIRKKFVKNSDAHEAPENPSSGDDLVLGDVVLRQENISLRCKLKNLQKDKCEIEIKNEELVLNVEGLNKNISDLEKENSSLSIRLEVANGQLSNEKDKSKIQVENMKLVETEEKAIRELHTESENKIVKLEKELKGIHDDLLISEFTIKNRDAEIERLKTELDIFKAKSFHPCDDCGFSSENDSDLKIHMNERQKQHCEHCKCDYIGQKKFMKHLCRIQVTNPCSDQFGLYTKDWFERDKCVRIFDIALKEEVILLHSDKCIEDKVCGELPIYFHKEKCFKDTHGLIHLRVSDYMESNSMKWMHMLGMKIMFKSE